jgi:hypothetical protein
MKRLVALFPLALALGATILVPGAGAQAQGPTEISKCQTIDKSGSYILVNNLTASFGVSCLVITANFVTIDLAGFTISGTTARSQNFTAGLTGVGPVQGIAVRNGTISGFDGAVDLGGIAGSIIEELRLFCGGSSAGGIGAQGVVKGNTVTHCGNGISGAGTISGNTIVGDTSGNGIDVDQGSTVIGNAVTNNRIGILANCPSNVTDNTAFNNGFANLILFAPEPVPPCNNTNNVAP